MEDRQLDAALVRQRDELLLGAIDLPVGSEVAAVLGGVGVADHHLEARPRAPVEDLSGELSRASEVVDRLEQRHCVDVQTRRASEGLRREHVAGARGHRHDHAVDRARPVAFARLGGRGECGDDVLGLLPHVL